MNLPFNFDSAIDGLHKITLKGGVVTKQTFAIVVVCLSITVITWGANDVWLSRGAVAGILLFAFVMMWRQTNFADRHPQAALLEGAEFLAHQQIVHASKNMPVIPAPQTMQVEPEPVEGLAPSIELADAPDQEATEADDMEGKN